MTLRVLPEGLTAASSAVEALTARLTAHGGPDDRAHLDGRAAGGGSVEFVEC